MNMSDILKIFMLVFLVATVQESFAQNKKRKLNKGNSKREIKKRQEDANKKDVEEGNTFNELMPMGSRVNDSRDDLLWHYESANTVYPGAGNISLTSPSRYGLKKGLELSSTIPLNFWVPNITLKKRWANDKWYIASKHGLYSGTPGLKWGLKNGYSSVSDYISRDQNNSDITNEERAKEIPFILAMKNEIIFSKIISKSSSCSREKPYIILSTGIGVDYGYAFGDSTISEINEHFLANRSPALTGNGYLAYAKVRADWQINEMFMLGGGLKYFYGEFTGRNALEHNADLQVFVLPKLSISVGYMLSIANYDTPKHIAIFPFADLTYYFGRKQGRERGLWGGSKKR